MGYASILGRGAISNSFLELERLLFAKVLSTQPHSNLEVTPGVLLMPTELQMPEANRGPRVAEAPQQESFLDNLLPDAYCLEAIRTWRKLNRDHKTALLGPHLIEAFHHLFLHEISGNKEALDSAKALFNEASAALRDAGANRYAATILAFQHFGSNVILGLIQFHFNPADIVDFAEYVAAEVRDLSWMGEDPPKVMRSTPLARMELGLLLQARKSGKKTYGEMLRQLDRIDRVTVETSDKLLYVQGAVTVAYGFETQDNVPRAMAILEKARGYVASSKSVESSDAFTKFLGQLARETERWDLPVEAIELLEEAGQIAAQHPQSTHGILSTVFRETATLFTRYTRQRDESLARRAMALARSTLESGRNENYDKRQRIVAGAFLGEPLNAYVDGWDALLEDTCAFFEHCAQSPIVAWEQTIHNPNLFANFYGLANHALVAGDIERAARALEVLGICSRHDDSVDYATIIAQLRLRLERAADERRARLLEISQSEVRASDVEATAAPSGRACAFFNAVRRLFGK